MTDVREENCEPGVPHPIQRRWWAEQLVRRRRADEEQRYAASQRRGRIDPNPHQIDAVIFALRRIRDGGCILADEVGLGKTIEAGLIIAQLLAEGARRVLLILPKPLMGQWRAELFDLFGIESREATAGPSDAQQLAGRGVFLAGREFAASPRGSELISSVEPFDLCIIDEAHEIFAGLYKRYDRAGEYDAESEASVMAGRLKSCLGLTPVLLLTATPIQNTLTELWGLIQYVEPTGTLLGNINTFRELFCEPGTGDRTVRADQVQELRHRINTVCQRTLRRQAQEFLEKPFTQRRAQLFEYEMSVPELELYDAVTDYLLQPNLCAFRGRQRRLLLIAFHRRMASSLAALAASLKKVAERLQKMHAGQTPDDDHEAETLAADLEDDELPELGAVDEAAEAPSRDRIAAELALVRQFVARAESLPSDAKAQRLIQAVRMLLQRGQSGQGSGKVVIFTESLTTQDYLAKLLVNGGLGLGIEEVTLFRGVNDSPRAAQALQRWQEEVGKDMDSSSRLSRDVATRLALVHEFRTRSRVFISTEAGAKGLNLQFCETVINYDLPWNPQRIEQRIGRCHRYRQEHDVTVINFLNRDNDAERLTLQILFDKLELFGQVLDASDAVLHQPRSDTPGALATVMSGDFESQLRRVYERARSRDELADGLRELSDSMDEQRQRFEDTQRRTASLIESRFDESVRRVFRQIAETLPAGLAQLDQQVDRVVTGYLQATAVPFERTILPDGRVELKCSPLSPRAESPGMSGQHSNDLHLDERQETISQASQGALAPGVTTGPGAPRLAWSVSSHFPFALVIGSARETGSAEPLHLGHPIVQAALDEAHAATAKRFCVTWSSTSQNSQRRGRLVVTKVSYDGFEPVDHLLVTALLEGERDPLPVEFTVSLLQQTPRDVEQFDPPIQVSEDDLVNAVEEAVFVDQLVVEQTEQARFDRMLEQIDRYADDQTVVLSRQRLDLQQRLKSAQKERDGAVGSDVRRRAEEKVSNLTLRLEELEARIGRLQRREDDNYQKWRTHTHRRYFGSLKSERIIDVEFNLT